MRITPEMVREAMEKTGYKLVQGETLRNDQCCGCPLGLIALAKDPDLDFGRDLWLYTLVPYSVRTIIGFSEICFREFAAAFDGTKLRPLTELDQDAIDARNDGLACRKAFIE